MITTRRSALAALAGAAIVTPGLKAAKKATAFALIGDRYHNSDYIRIGLTRTIAKQMDVTIDFTQQEAVQAILDATNGRGVDVAIEALGSQGTSDFTGVDMLWSNPTPRHLAIALYQALILDHYLRPQADLVRRNLRRIDL